MKNKPKTFPNNKIIIILLTFLIICCNSEENPQIDDTEFIDIYARFLIVNELKTEKAIKDSLVLNIFEEKSTTVDEFNKTLEYYKRNPEEWVLIMQKTRDHIRKIKNLQPGESEPVE